MFKAYLDLLLTAIKEKVDTKKALMFYSKTIPLSFIDRVYDNKNGKKLLEEKFCSLAKKTTNNEYLGTLPEGSLGKELYYFYQNDKMKDYREDLKYCFEQDKRLSKLNTYERKKYIRTFNQIIHQHDLMHVLLKFDTTLLGEAYLHTYMSNHIKANSIKIIALTFLIVEFIRWLSPYIPYYGYKVYQQSKQAPWLFVVDWEKYLDKQLSTIRKEFNITCH